MTPEEALESALPVVPFSLLEWFADWRASSVYRHDECHIEAYVGPKPHTTVIIRATVRDAQRVVLLVRWDGQGRFDAAPPWELMGTDLGGYHRNAGAELCWTIKHLARDASWRDITGRALASLVTAPSADRLQVPR